MNQTGIIRKIDELGRIVLPKELRKHLNINSGDDFQILLDGDKIILEKYSYLKNYEVEIINIINSFKEVTLYDINLIINDLIVNKNNTKINKELVNIIKERKIYSSENTSKILIENELSVEGNFVLLPIVVNSDLLGAILIVSKDNVNNMLNVAKIIFNIIKKYYY